MRHPVDENGKPRDVVIGCHADDRAGLIVIPGGQTLPCHRCKGDTWVAPASLGKLEAGAIVVCNRCITKEEWGIAEVTEETKQELKAWNQRGYN